MASVAVFVDAGYLFAQGSTALAGSSVARSQLVLDCEAAKAALKRAALAKSDDCRLLRIYWYDGVKLGRLSMEQSSLATLDDIKLRLGQVNSAGQQKGVDSLIVMDLIELARNRAVSDALLVSGDEDVRIGVQIAQSFGVRVHLLGIKAGKHSQSPLLVQEADTTTIWTRSAIEVFLSIRSHSISAETESDSTSGIEDIVAAFAASLTDDQLQDFAEYRKAARGVPPEFDGRLLAKARDRVGRDLDALERKGIRAGFVDAVKARSPDLFKSR